MTLLCFKAFRLFVFVLLASIIVCVSNNIRTRVTRGMSEQNGNNNGNGGGNNNGNNNGNKIQCLGCIFNNEQSKTLFLIFFMKK